MSIAKNISMDQGANSSIEIAVANSSGNPLDMSTYTANAQFKRHTESANAGYFETAAYANGIVKISLNAANSATLSEGVYVYRINITDSANTTTRIQEGLFTLNGE